MLYILETNASPTDYYPGNYTLKSIVDVLEESRYSFNTDCTVFIESYALFDSRSFMTRTNRMFCYKVQEAISRGVNIVLIVPSKDYVDKRLRSIATVFSIPKARISEEEEIKS